MEILIKGLAICLLSIVLLHIQVRIIRTLFPDIIVRKKILLYTLLMGGLVASGLVFFEAFIKAQWPGLPGLYSVYIVILGGILSLLFAYKRHRRGVFFASTSTIVAFVTGIGEFILTGSTLGAILLKVTGEEVLKSSSAQSITSHSKLFSSDIIVYSILAGLGFAFWENIVYFLAQISIGQFIARSITVTLLHAIFTGTTGYILWRYKQTSYLGYCIAYMGGIGLHSAYNIGLGVAPTITGILFIVGGYFLLSYLLYKSDRLYSQQQGKNV